MPVGWRWPHRFHRRRPARTARGQGVLEIPGGVVFGRRGHYGPDPEHVLVDACALWADDAPRALAEAERARAFGLVDLDGVTMSLWANGGNYAHCLLQSIPRLALLERAFGWDADRFLLVDGTPAPMLEAIAHVGVPADRIMLVPRVDAPAYRCTTLRAATSPLTDEFGVPWVADFLASVFLPTARPSTPPRLYVRRGVARRRVLNEEHVLAALEPGGFTVVELGGRPVSEQATLFANAEVVVASHGAALANLVFCRPGTKVIELLGPNTATPAFAELAWRRTLDYRVIMGTEPTVPARWWRWQPDADTRVDVVALRRCLDDLGIRVPAVTTT
jgi:capsular polysaccharide biosynthesis protein